MSSFPPSKWEVRFVKDMHTMSCEALDDDQIHMAAFMALRPAGGEEGCFRFDLQGPSKLKIRFEVAEVLNSPLFENMIAEAELDVGDQIRMEKNSCGSPWVDLVDLVRSQDFLITDSEDNDVAEDFLHNLDLLKEQQEKSAGRGGMVGISLRWILGTSPDNPRVILFAQVTWYKRCQETWKRGRTKFPPAYCDYYFPRHCHAAWPT